MKSNRQEKSVVGERRRWLGAIAAGLAGAVAWTLGKRAPVDSAGAPASHAVSAAPTTPPYAPVPHASKLVVRPAAGAVKRHG